MTDDFPLLSVVVSTQAPRQMLTLLRAPARRCSSPFSCTCERPRTHLRYFFISLKETLTQSTWQSFAVSQDPPDGYSIFAVSVDRQQPHNPNRSLTYWHNFKEKKSAAPSYTIHQGRMSNLPMSTALPPMFASTSQVPCSSITWGNAAVVRA